MAPCPPLCVAVDERLGKYVIHARLVRGMFPETDHQAVLTKVRMHMVWRWKREKKEVKRRVATERLKEESVRKRYRERLERE